MQQETIEYYDDKQKLIGQLIFDAKATQKKPIIIIFPAFEGIGEFSIEYGKRLAEAGFVSFVADMYGDGKSTDTIEGALELISPFLKDRELVRRRATLAFTTAAGIDQADSKHIGTIGFCFGGMCALEVARSGADLKALVSAHGVLKKSDLPTEPINAKLLILHGYKDPQVPPNSLTAFADEMEEANVNDWAFMFFGNAKHSFTDPKTGTFDAEKEAEMGREYDAFAAKNSFHFAVDFFKETLLG